MALPAGIAAAVLAILIGAVVSTPAHAGCVGEKVPAALTQVGRRATCAGIQARLFQPDVRMRLNGGGETGGGQSDRLVAVDDGSLAKSEGKG